MTTIVDATWRPLEPGDVVGEGDAMRIGKSFSVIRPCVYDRAGETCCVGAVVDERFRWYRAAAQG